MSSFKEESKEPEKTSPDEYLHRWGVGDFGTIRKTSEISYTRAEEASRLKIEEETADIQNRITFLNFIVKDVAVNVVGLVLVVILAATSIFILFSDSATPDDEKWAHATLSGIVGAIAGFVFGKNNN